MLSWWICIQAWQICVQASQITISFSIDGWCQGALPVNICHLHVHAIPVASSRQVSCRSNFYISKHGQKFLQVKMTFLLELDRSCAHNFRFRCVWKWLGFSQPHRKKTCLKWFFHFNSENDLWVLGLIQQKRWSTFYLGNVSSTSTQLSSKIMATHRLPNTCQIAIIKHKQHVVGEGVSNIMEASLFGELVGFKFQTVTLPQGEVRVGEFE